MPSFILIRQTVWPQYTNVTDRTDRTDRQRSDSIGRTVFTNGRPTASLTYVQYLFYLPVSDIFRDSGF